MLHPEMCLALFCWLPEKAFQTFLFFRTLKYSLDICSHPFAFITLMGCFIGGLSGCGFFKMITHTYCPESGDWGGLEPFKNKMN